MQINKTNLDNIFFLPIDVNSELGSYSDLIFIKHRYNSGLNNVSKEKKIFFTKKFNTIKS